MDIMGNTCKNQLVVGSKSSFFDWLSENKGVLEGTPARVLSRIM